MINSFKLALLEVDVRVHVVHMVAVRLSLDPEPVLLVQMV